MNLQNKITTVIFDLDGTLADTLDDLCCAVNFAMAQMQFPARTRDEVQSFIGNGIAMLIRRSVPQGTDDAACAQALTLFRTYYSAHLLDHTAPYDGIVPLLHSLRERGVAVGVVSNKNHEAAQPIVQTLFSSLVRQTVGKRAGFPTKPDPASVLEVMRLLGGTTEDTLYVGDSDVDVQTAHNASLPCIGAAWGYRGAQTLAAAGADAVIDKPQALLQYI